MSHRPRGGRWGAGVVPQIPARINPKSPAHVPPALADIDLPSLPSGLVAVTGDERSGKTTCLRRLAGEVRAAPGEAGDADALWLDLALPGRDDETPEDVWAAVRRSCPRWNERLRQELVEALGLGPHLGKKLFMLSTGSRRKVALVALLASGAKVTCLDQPFAALDGAASRVLREFLADVADHPTRTWIVADYTADTRLPWKRQIALG